MWIWSGTQLSPYQAPCARTHCHRFPKGKQRLREWCQGAKGEGVTTWAPPSTPAFLLWSSRTWQPPVFAEQLMMILTQKSWMWGCMNEGLRSPWGPQWTHLESGFSTTDLPQPHKVVIGSSGKMDVRVFYKLKSPKEWEGKGECRLQINPQGSDLLGWEPYTVISLSTDFTCLGRLAPRVP